MLFQVNSVPVLNFDYIQIFLMFLKKKHSFSFPPFSHYVGGMELKL